MSRKKETWIDKIAIAWTLIALSVILICVVTALFALAPLKEILWVGGVLGGISITFWAMCHCFFMDSNQGKNRRW